jgi:hypothetical protein
MKARVIGTEMNKSCESSSTEAFFDIEESDEANFSSGFDDVLGSAPQLVQRPWSGVIHLQGSRRIQ